ncbi:serine/threonine-protein kinase [Streptomyces phaeofaciens JCM 4814]|uniref:non-specific serine/threonine protein kinase n=2 Tax=Streptomyces phaeofaciens TaxID=68254 RepID=A0A918H6C5_9ACTN|nr:serine/threonine-protein kinase [Streptomyces phaeofaciens]GGT40519.1 hypothetical protein GCM10010226_15980 [Streptomyces phaeofaciens]
MGRVWRATDEMLDRPVAVKEMRIDGLDPEDTRTRRERTLREARATARIDHPHVVRVYDVVDEGERLWIVMELVAGRSLERVMAEDGPLGPAQTARIGLGLVAALRQVHARGVLHRDIKPGNVLVEDTGGAEPDGGRVVLTDFGIAAIQDAKALTMVGMLVGSPDYMAPERISGRPQGPPSDVWSLGATLCAALAGHSPFSRDTTLATLHAVLYEEPELPPGAGPLREILAALLEKEPQVRASLAEVAAALRPVAFPAPAPSPTPTAGEGEPGAGESPTRALRRPARAAGPYDPRLPAVPGAPAEGASPPRSRAGAEPPSPGPAGGGTRPRPSGAAFGVSPTRAAAETERRPPPDGPPGSAPAGRTRRRTRAVAAAAAVVAVGAVVAVVLALAPGGGGEKDEAGGTSRPSTPRSTPGTPTPSPTVEGTSRPRSLPPGTHAEAGGFAWATPRGWRRDVKTGAEVHYTSPDGTQELVAKSSLARGDLMDTWETSERNARQGADYEKIRLEETTFRGRPAVVWEYTFTLRGARWHARLLGFDESGTSYQINTWYRPGIEAEALRTYETVKDSFTVL